MAKRTPNSVRYKHALPIHPIDDLPQLIPHNPISWLYWFYKYWQSTNLQTNKITVDIIGNEYHHILIRDPIDMKYLWENGFFGTGQLSRSEPTWYKRTLSRLGADEEDNNELSLETVTERRRLQRSEFKKERVKLEQQLLELRKQGTTVNLKQEAELLERERENLRKFRDNQESMNDMKTDIEIKKEDGELIDSEGNVIRLESLELMPTEALFLTFALPLLEITPLELIRRLVGDLEVYTPQLHKLLIQYAAYHHYRSHGWCVRSGIKFGCDFLLYKRGPPFQHAEFCIMAIDHDDDTRAYTWYSSIARVAGGANKTLVLSYVEKLESDVNILQYLQKGQLNKVMESYKIGEVIYRRWVPGRNRD